MGADRKKAFFMLIAGSCERSVGVALVPCQARGEIQACRADNWNPGFKNGQNRKAVAPKARREAVFLLHPWKRLLRAACSCGGVR